MSEIILKSGIEIHQQLDTGKLFCSCPGILRQDAPDYTIERELHAIAGETGEVDEAVKFESGRKRKFTYQAYNDNCCLVELDEEPPHQINQEALKVALQISLLLNCEIIPYTQIMRKTVIDGSNTSGFQRTLILARNGWVETSAGKVVVDMTGGAEAPQEIFYSFGNSGINTIVGMHFSEEWYIQAADHQIQIVCAGHAPSDNLGMNLLLDEILPQDIELFPNEKFPKIGGFRRFSHIGDRPSLAELIKS